MAAECQLFHQPEVLTQPESYGRPLVGERIMSLYGLPNASSARPIEGNCSDTRGWAYKLSYAECRLPPLWCEMAASQAAGAHPTFGGMLPCSLTTNCMHGLRKTAFYHGHSRKHAIHHCLRNKRIAMVGDSTMQEIMTELALYLADDVPSFKSAFISPGYKFKWNMTCTRIEAGPITAIFWPNQRNWTFQDVRLNLTVSFVHGGALFLRDHMGLQTLTHPAFEPELERLGLAASTPAHLRPDLAVFGTSFHDDTQLGGACGEQSRRECSCTSQPAGNAVDAHWPGNLSWAERFQRYQYHARRAAQLIARVQASGTRVTHMSLFPRIASRVRQDYLRAVADGAVLAELRAVDFFQSGGRYIDQWPIYKAYFDVAQQGRANFGPSSLHNSQLSIRDNMLTADLSFMRLTLLLNAWCNESPIGASPCGVGSLFLPQAQYVSALNPTCSCGAFGMSILPPRFCSPGDEVHTTIKPHMGPSPKHALQFESWIDSALPSDTGGPNSTIALRAAAIQRGSLLNPDWPGRTPPYGGGRPWFVPEGGIDFTRDS